MDEKPLNGAGRSLVTNPEEFAADLESPSSLEALFRQYVEATPLGILLVNASGTITFANASVCSFLGYEPAEMLGQPIEVLVPNCIQERHVTLRDGYLRRPEQRLMANRELRARRKDGTEISVAIGLNPLSSDRPCGVACSVLDLSELRTAQSELTRFFDLSPDLFCIASVEGFFRRVNLNFSRVLGYPDEVLLARPFLDFIHPNDVAATQATVAELATGRPVVQFRNRFRDCRGDYRWFEWSARAVPEEGTIFAVGRDITERVAMEKELLVRERRERAILDNTPAAVYVKGCGGRYEYANQRYADRFALAPGALLDRCEHEIGPVNGMEDSANQDRDVFLTGDKITLQESVVQEDGLHTYVSVKFPLFDARGKVAAVAGMSTDITEQLRAQETSEQLRVARAFQRKLYPARAPTVAGLDVGGAAVSVAQLGGDCYYFIPDGPGRLVVAVADVSGHGIGPSLEMVAVRTMLRMLLRNTVDLSRTVQEINQMLCEDLPDSSFVSLFLAEIDAPRGQIRYVGAGHEAMLFPSGGKLTRLKSTGPLLGVAEEASFAEAGSVSVGPGDLFLICTDGVTDGMNLKGDRFGFGRLVHVVSAHRQESSEAVIQNLFMEVYEFASGRTIVDDMTVIAVKILG